MKFNISVFWIVFISSNVYAYPSCLDILGEIPIPDMVEFGDHQKELFSFYGLKLQILKDTKAEILIKAIEEAKSIKAGNGIYEQVAITCSDESSVGFSMQENAPILTGFFLLKNGCYHAGPLVYFEGNPIIIRADDSMSLKSNR